MRRPSRSGVRSPRHVRCQTPRGELYALSGARSDTAGVRHQGVNAARSTGLDLTSCGGALGPRGLPDVSLASGLARLYAGLSQEELAEAVGASRATISSIERGLSIPAVTLAISIARRLDVDVEALFAADALR
ncbi:MAG: helix-turn-helix transcriptional regulator [Actinobacteria bacterium]|nr:helix-turn-helix transcriptional regulator [Actinomycetota bacterium]